MIEGGKDFSVHVDFLDGSQGDYYATAETQGELMSSIYEQMFGVGVGVGGEFLLLDADIIRISLIASISVDSVEA